MKNIEKFKDSEKDLKAAHNKFCEAHADECAENGWDCRDCLAKWLYKESEN